MNLTDYQGHVFRTMNPKDPMEFHNYILGLIGESGELIDHLKKHLHHNHGIDLRYVLLESGDVLWYLTALMTKMGLSLEKVATANVEKLKERYPEGYSDKNSHHTG